MSNKTENKNEVKPVTKSDVKNIVKAVDENKIAYNKCNDLMLTIVNAYSDIISICNKDTNSLPASTVARMLHLLGKAEGSRAEQFVNKYGQIEKRIEKEKSKVIREAKRTAKTIEKQKALLSKLSPEQLADLKKTLEAVKM